MEEGETTDSDLSMEEGQIADTRQSTPDSMDIGVKASTGLDSTTCTKR